MTLLRVFVSSWRVFSFVLICSFAEPASAQSFAIGLEAARDRFTYHFDNPSSFDTPQLVPHFFEQSYVSDNLWLVASVRYTAAIVWETSAAVTLERTLPATDYDSFFNPDGTVIVAGTSGDAAIHSLRVSQRGELGQLGRVAFVAGYTIRLDRADFLVGHKTVSRNGRIDEAFDVTTAEMTSSLVQEFLFGARIGKNLGSGWRMTVGAEGAPPTTGRLAIQLPEKYPGATFVFVSTSLTGTGRVTFSRAPNRRPIELSIEGAGTWGYTSENYLSRNRVALRVSVDLRTR